MEPFIRPENRQNYFLSLCTGIEEGIHFFHWRDFLLLHSLEKPYARGYGHIFQDAILRQPRTRMGSVAAISRQVRTNADYLSQFHSRQERMRIACRNFATGKNERGLPVAILQQTRTNADRLSQFRSRQERVWIACRNFAANKLVMKDTHLK